MEAKWGQPTTRGATRARACPVRARTAASWIATLGVFNPCLFLPADDSKSTSLYSWKLFSDKALLNSLLPLISETPRLIYSNQRDWHQTWVSFSQKLLDAATAIKVPMALHSPQDQGRGQVCFTSHTPRLRPGKGACIPTPADLSRRADGRSLVSAARTSLQKGSHQGIPRDQEH